MRFRLGYACTCLSLGVGASHTTRLSHATPKKLEALIAQNLAELELILRFNASHGIGVFRISSSLVPFASHGINTVKWWKTFRRDFEAIGRIATASGQRLSMHPSPASGSISTQRPEVLEAMVRELHYATTALDLLGQDGNGRVVMHMGGAAPDKATAFDTAHRALQSLSRDTLRRFTLEHDDWIWTAREVLPLALEHGIPFLADQLHNAVLPSAPVMEMKALFAASARSFKSLGLRPKFHIASQKSGGRKGAHADFISRADWRRIFAALPADSDLMIEAKHKDLALFALRVGGAPDVRTAPPLRPLGPEPEPAAY